MPKLAAEGLTPDMQRGTIGGHAGLGTSVGADIGGLRHLLRSKEEREQQGLLSTLGKHALLGGGIGAGVGANRAMLQPWPSSTARRWPSIPRSAGPSH